MKGTRKSVGSRELKTRLGSYLRQVQNGATLVVTERGRPVAELRPLSIDVSGDAERLKELVELGILTRDNEEPLKPFEAIRTDDSLSQAIIEDREDRV